MTDWIDGFLARRLKQITVFGAFLDPVADKLMVAVALVLLVQANPEIWIALPAAIIIGREIAISALREWMARIGEHRRVAVVMLGKFKTGCQLTAITLMLYGSERRPRENSFTGGSGAPLSGHHPHAVVHGALSRRGAKPAAGGRDDGAAAPAGRPGRTEASDRERKRTTRFMTARIVCRANAVGEPEGAELA